MSSQENTPYPDQTYLINELIEVVSQLNSITTSSPILIQYLVQKQQEIETALEELRKNC
jgi:hypothetical protein